MVVSSRGVGGGIVGRDGLVIAGINRSPVGPIALSQVVVLCIWYFTPAAVFQVNRLEITLVSGKDGNVKWRRCWKSKIS
jgi:hypothetical protein